MEIKKGDAVKIIAGKDKGQTGEVIRVLPQDNKIVVEGVNKVFKSVRPRSATEKGGIVEQPAAFDASNAMLICPACHEATRVSHAVVDGRKVRICKHCGANIDEKAAKGKSTAKKAAKKASKKAEDKE